MGVFQKGVIFDLLFILQLSMIGKKLACKKYFYLHVVLLRGVPIVAAIAILLEQLENSEGTLSQFSLLRFVPSLP